MNGAITHQLAPQVQSIFQDSTGDLMRTINVRSLQDRMLKTADELDVDFTLKHQLVLGEILTEMANGRRRDAYSHYLPHLHLDSNPPNRKIVSEALGFIWGYCQKHLYPELNYLVVEKRSGYPGKFMKETWKELYGRFTMDQFELYCDMRANESIRMLNRGLIRFNTENVITRGDLS
jgi:hypothetical protein